MKRYIELRLSGLVSSFPKAVNVIFRFLVEEYGYARVREFIKKEKAEELFVSVNKIRRRRLHRDGK